MLWSFPFLWMHGFGRSQIWALIVELSRKFQKKINYKTALAICARWIRFIYSFFPLSWTNFIVIKFIITTNISSVSVVNLQTYRTLQSLPQFWIFMLMALTENKKIKKLLNYACISRKSVKYYALKIKYALCLSAFFF